jgi:hypothetical protein
VVLEVCAETAPKGPHPGRTHPIGVGCGPGLKGRGADLKMEKENKGKKKERGNETCDRISLLFCCFFVV